MTGSSWRFERRALVARVRGEKALGFLDDTTSQDLSLVRPGRGALTCMLDEKGRVLAEVRVLPLASGDVLLDGEPAAREAIVGWLARVAPLSGCEVADESDAWHAVAVRGPRASDALPALGPLPAQEHAFVERDGAIVVRVEWGPPGWDVLARAVPAIDAPAIAEAAFEAARIAAGRPRFGVDFGEATHVTETPLADRAVSATKGCYPGQESVARVRNLGRPRRALVGLAIRGAAPAPGAPVERDGVEVGAVTSAAATPEGAVAIALVRAEVELGAAVTVGGEPAEARAL